jgi:hypothetical protein
MYILVYICIYIYSPHHPPVTVFVVRAGAALEGVLRGLGAAAVAPVDCARLSAGVRSRVQQQLRVGAGL